MNSRQFSFSEMTCKRVINVADGTELGHVCDLIFTNCGQVLGLAVPGKKNFFRSVASCEQIFIPWNRIIKIGTDVILVELCRVNDAMTFGTEDCACSTAEAEQENRPL